MTQDNLFFEKSHNWQIFEQSVRALPEYETWKQH